MKTLAEGINRVEHSKIKFGKDTMTGKWNCTLIGKDDADFATSSSSVHNPLTFMVGDLKFLSMMLGKEDLDSYWCYAHMVNQMRAVKGGLFDLDESWIQHYHQKGYNFDMKLRNQGSESRKAASFLANDRRESRPKTQQALKKLDKHKRGKRKATVQKEEEQKRIKTERRDGSLK